ncbi:hypothetical protein [Paenibacillus farraposensis]|nr:hypothetical protein [Paenibacillus farraposensis]
MTGLFRASIMQLATPHVAGALALIKQLTNASFTTSSHGVGAVRTAHQAHDSSRQFAQGVSGPE